MATVAELTTQKQVFIQAYKEGRITSAQYNEAMAYTQAEINRIKGREVAARVQTPKGYSYVKTETHTALPMPTQPGESRAGYDPMNPVKQVTYHVYQKDPSFIAVSTGFFGVESYYPYESAPAELKAKAVYRESYSPEERASLGLALATTGAMVVTVPAATVGAGIALGAGETVKVGLTGEHLTPSEAVGLASAGAFGGIVAVKAYPYAKSAVGKAYNALSPERAMYNRVVSAQQPKASFAEQIVGKISPERAMYGRVVKSATPLKPSSPTGITGISAGKGGASQWVQQQLVKQTTVQKASTYAMKPFLETVVLPKTVTVNPAQSSLVKSVTKTQSAQVKQATKTVPQQVVTVQKPTQNPFLQFSGKPFYRQSAREQEETLFVVYPKTSPLSSPAAITRTSLLSRVTQTQKASPLTKGILEQVPVQVLNPLQDQGSMVTQVLDQRSAQQQVSETVQSQQAQQREIERYINLGGFDAPAGFGRMNDLVFGRYSRYKRRYPLMTGKQMLEEIFG